MTTTISGAIISMAILPPRAGAVTPCSIGVIRCNPFAVSLDAVGREFGVSAWRAIGAIRSDVRDEDCVTQRRMLLRPL